MTGLQIYGLVAPLVLGAMAWVFTIWVHHADVRGRRDPAAGPTRPAE